MKVIRWLLALLAAVVVTAAVGSVIQTQLTLARLAALETPISFSTRIETTLFDLGGFAPTYAIIVALALLVGLLVAGGLAYKLHAGRTTLHLMAGFAAVATALGLMSVMLPVTAIAAARSAFGFIALCLAGALGAWVYLQVLGSSARTQPRQNGQT